MNYNNSYRPGRFGHLPTVTKNIIIINVVLFALKLILAPNVNLDDYLGLHYYLAPSFKLHQFVTYIFMHGNLSHLFFNMFGVYMFGQVLEQVWGPRRYLIFYIVTGLGAALTQYVILHVQMSELLESINAEIVRSVDSATKSYLINRKYQILDGSVIIGASGSLFGLLGAFGMLFPNQMLYIYFLFPVKAKWLVIAYGLLELISGLSSNPGDNVAHFAHLGGLFVGLILVLIWKKNRTRYH
jgi:membrane associated rhomboid family serine protease